MVPVPHLLHLDSAASLKNSRSRGITATFADTWRGRGPEYSVTYRDLHRDPLPHLADAVLHELVGELLGADVLLVGAPLYNYSVPSSLKTWIDHVHIPARTAPF